MASVIVVENELKDSVREYGQIIDGINGNQDFSSSLAPFFNANEEINNKPELGKMIFQGSPASLLSRLSDKEFEPAFYLLFYLVSELNLTPFDVLLTKDSSIMKLLIECTPTQQPSLRDRRSLKPTTILSVLNTFFNFLAPSSPSRIYLVELILSIVSSTGIDFALVQSSIGENLVAWLTAAGASDATTKLLFWKFIALDSAYSLKSLQLIKKFTGEFSVSLPELHNLIKFALNSPVVDVSFLVNNKVAAALHENHSDELAALFVKYTRGDLIPSVPSGIPQSVVDKSRILALTRFFVESETTGKFAFSYSDIPSDLVSSDADFEKLLIDAIKAGVIEGKLNQVSQSFHLVRVNRFILAGDNEKLARDRDSVQKALYEWKHSLENINGIVRDAKDNIVNNNASS